MRKNAITAFTCGADTQSAVCVAEGDGERHLHNSSTTLWAGPRTQAIQHQQHMRALVQACTVCQESRLSGVCRLKVQDGITGHLGTAVHHGSDANATRQQLVCHLHRIPILLMAKV